MQPLCPFSHSDRLTGLVDFLSGSLVSSLFQHHPNDAGTSSFLPPVEWSDWWDWAGADQTHDRAGENRVDPWYSLLQYYDWCRRTPEGGMVEQPPDFAATIPCTLRALVENACRLALPRELGTVVTPCSGTSLRSSPQDAATRRWSAARGSSTPMAGMSPKKAHEVVQMSDFIGSMLQSDASLSSIEHVVDVGAGQAYLSRTLRDSLGLHVLGLDFSDVQTQGAAKRDATKPKRKSPSNSPANSPCAGHATSEQTQSDAKAHDARHGSLTYVTTVINADTLREATHDWMDHEHGTSGGTQDRVGQKPAPVLFVALHACGSLTPDILRAFSAAARKEESGNAIWTLRAAVIVGCCYNMLRPEDFPLSSELSSIAGPPITLSPGHLQLAAQVPSQWTRTEETLRDARLALRKIVWRALIQDVFHDEQNQSTLVNDKNTEYKTGPPTTHSRPSTKRLGRLNDAAYADWPTFAQRVETKLGLPNGRLVRANRALEKRIAVFHVLRCIVGPVIESLLLLDRTLWAQEALQGTGLDVELVNLFDQASGSGRNVAIVIRPGIAR